MKKYSRTLLGMVLIWSCICCDSGVFSPDSGGRKRNYIYSFPETKDVTLNIQGTVADAQSSSPIRHAKIVLYHLPDPFTRVELKDVESNKEGTYSLSFSGEVRWKFVYLEVSKSGYITQEKWIKYVSYSHVQEINFELIKSET